MYKIVHTRVLSPTIKLFEVEAPEVAAKAKAGQFIILRMDETGERIPLTIADFDCQKGIITIIFQEVGYTTKKLGELSSGDTILDFVGPLGRPTEIENFGRVVCVGGGVGVAPVYPIVKALKAAGNEVISIIGARNKELLILEDEMQAASDQLLVATDDGSYGHKGFVTDLLKQVIEEQGGVKRVWGIGPMVMMRVLAKTMETYSDIPTIVSLNPIMVDGTGMCGACRVSVGGETKFACVDGPEFDAHQIDWELAMRRLTIYKEEEQRALAAASCGGDC